MFRKFRNWLSIQLAKNPGRVVVAAILTFNLVFLFIAALIISSFSLKGTESMGFFEAAFYTVTMILDPGCISFVVSDIGESGVVIALVCLAVVIIGMVSFTGAIIGYVTNYISNFIATANAGSRKLNIADHLVILNWNTRASEIVNDLLYRRGKQKVVVLAENGKEDIKKELDERISGTIRRENLELHKRCEGLSFLRRKIRYRSERLKNNLTVIIREGDVFSSKQLADISLDRARAVVILGSDITSSSCKYETAEKLAENEQGNANIVKTLMQVSDITSAETSADDQKIIVEISDDWTWELVNKIINYKQVRGKCNIVPIRINRILGQLLSQFSLMPELNLAYRELFSNKGATFYVEERSVADDDEYITGYLKNHKHAIPLTSMESEGKDHFYYSALSERDLTRISDIPGSSYSVKLDRKYWIEKKKVIILGHNSKCREIMQSFCAFRDEWNYRDSDDEILSIIVIDDEKNLEKMNWYRDYPFVKEAIAASVYDKEMICSAIESFVALNDEDTSILILSDDRVPTGEIDANALASLIYVQDIISARKAADPDFDCESIDVIVEIIDPKHHDIVSSYSVDNVVISNRYISKMITQIGEKEAIFDFYTDILTYDSEDAVDSGAYESKEVYTKKVSSFFEETPGKCTQSEFIRALWNASTESSPEGGLYPTVALGYVKPGGRVTLFSGQNADTEMELRPEDKVIVFTSH